MPPGMNHCPCTKTEMTEMVFHVSLHHQFLLHPTPLTPCQAGDNTNPLLCSWKSVSGTVDSLHLNEVRLKSERPTSNELCVHPRTKWGQRTGTAGGHHRHLVPCDLDRERRLTAPWSHLTHSLSPTEQASARSGRPATPREHRLFRQL